MSEQTREVLDTIARVLLYCWVLGAALQLLTFVAVLSMSDIVHSMYGEVFALSIHESDVLIASYLALIKLSVAVFFFVPWVSIRLVLRTPKS